MDIRFGYQKSDTTINEISLILRQAPPSIFNDLALFCSRIGKCNVDIFDPKPWFEKISKILNGNPNSKNFQLQLLKKE